jgi:hypothetical protein
MKKQVINNNIIQIDKIITLLIKYLFVNAKEKNKIKAINIQSITQNKTV